MPSLALASIASASLADDRFVGAGQVDGRWFRGGPRDWRPAGSRPARSVAGLMPGRSEEHDQQIHHDSDRRLERKPRHMRHTSISPREPSDRIVKPLRTRLGPATAAVAKLGLG